MYLVIERIRRGPHTCIRHRLYVYDKGKCIYSKRKIDVRENYNHDRTIRINWCVRENITTRICLLGLDARKYSSAKISTFTVCGEVGGRLTDLFQRLLI